MIKRELINANRVLTINDNTKGSCLLVEVGTDSTTMIVIDEKNYGDIKEDIQFIKTFENKTYNELVYSAIWICREFKINQILMDSRGFGLGFYDAFINAISDTHIRIIEINKLINASYNGLIILAKDMINENLESGVLKFLQTSNCAKNTYVCTFLGYSEAMEAHRETDLLIEELCNLEIKRIASDKIILNKKDNNIGKSRASCLLLYYFYQSNLSLPRNNRENNKEE